MKSGNIKECYDLLGVSPGAPMDEVKKAYRDMVAVWHPDRFPNNPRLQKRGEEALKRINAAYARILKNSLSTEAATTFSPSRESDTGPPEKDVTPTRGASFVDSSGLFPSGKSSSGGNASGQKFDETEDPFGESSSDGSAEHASGQSFGQTEADTPRPFRKRPWIRKAPGILAMVFRRFRLIARAAVGLALGVAFLYVVAPEKYRALTEFIGLSRERGGVEDVERSRIPTFSEKSESLREASNVNVGEFANARSADETDAVDARTVDIFLELHRVMPYDIGAEPRRKRIGPLRESALDSERISPAEATVRDEPDLPYSTKARLAMVRERIRVHLRLTDGRFDEQVRGTVVDARTGLMWTLLDSCHVTGRLLNYRSAQAYVGRLETGGYQDWRLPTVGELAGIYQTPPVYSNDRPNESASGGCEWFWSSEMFQKNGERVARVFRPRYGADQEAEVIPIDRFGGVHAVRTP